MPVLAWPPALRASHSRPLWRQLLPLPLPSWLRSWRGRDRFVLLVFVFSFVFYLSIVNQTNFGKGQAEIIVIAADIFKVIIRDNDIFRVLIVVDFTALDFGFCAALGARPLDGYLWRRRGRRMRLKVGTHLFRRGYLSIDEFQEDCVHKLAIPGSSGVIRISCIRAWGMRCRASGHTLRNWLKRLERQQPCL